MILVVGSGLAGLTCAKVLHEAGREVRILEAADAPGGRIRTDHHQDGFLLDRGFHLLLTGYPTVKRHLDLAALRPRPLKPGAVIVREGKWHETGDPWPRRTFMGLHGGSPQLSSGDRGRLSRVQSQVRGQSVASIFTGKPGDRSASDELRARGFTQQFFDAFAGPYLGGVFLDRPLESSARFLLFLIKMLADGEVVLPEEGIGAVSAQLVAGLPAGCVRTGMRVEGIVEADERAVGVTLPGGEEMQGDAVIIATDAASARRLTRCELTAEPVAAACVYFASEQPLYSGPRLVVNGDAGALVSHVLQVSNVSPSCAPTGQHLIAVALSGSARADESELAARVLTDLVPWFPGHDLAGLRHLATYAVPHARFRQPAGIFANLPPNATPTKGLFLAGEYTESSTMHGAMHSGEKAAAAVLEYLRLE
jgi:phytoene dehydrogenase-like protein